MDRSIALHLGLDRDDRGDFINQLFPLVHQGRPRKVVTTDQLDLRVQIGDLLQVAVNLCDLNGDLAIRRLANVRGHIGQPVQHSGDVACAVDCSRLTGPFFRRVSQRPQVALEIRDPPEQTIIAIGLTQRDSQFFQGIGHGREVRSIAIGLATRQSVFWRHGPFRGGDANTGPRTSQCYGGDVDHLAAIIVGQVVGHVVRRGLRDFVRHPQTTESICHRQIQRHCGLSLRSVP